MKVWIFVLVKIIRFFFSIYSTSSQRTGCCNGIIDVLNSSLDIDFLMSISRKLNQR